MIIDSKLKTQYDLQYPYFEFIQRHLDQTLMNYAKTKLYAYSSRIKALNSICEKIEGGRYLKWNDIDDIIGCVLIIPNLSYEDEVIQFLNSIFNKVDVKKRGSTFKSFDVFRFDSTRFIGTIKPESEDKSSEVHMINFEVQIRTAFEHAWSVTTHDLAYKSQSIDWKVLRLAAQLKSSVEQLDMISLGAKDISKKITKSKWPEIDIKIELLKYLNEHFENGNIPNELKPKDFSRLVDNLYPLISKNLSLWKPKKWLYELKDIFKKIDSGIDELNKIKFPMSLSLFQILFGIMAQTKIISAEKVSNTTFFKSDSFHIIFPGLKKMKLKEFKI